MMCKGLPGAVFLASSLLAAGAASADVTTDPHVVTDADQEKLKILRDFDPAWLHSVKEAQQEAQQGSSTDDLMKMMEGIDMDEFISLMRASKSVQNGQVAKVSISGRKHRNGRHGKRQQQAMAQVHMRRLHIPHNHTEVIKVNESTAVPEVEVEIDYLGGTDVVLDHMWLLICGTFVFFMHAGFAMLEAGSGRAKNVQAILMKNLITVCAGTVGWYVMGWSLAYGGDALTAKPAPPGTEGFEECDMDENPMGCGDGYADNGLIGGKLMWAGSGFLGKGKLADDAWAEGTIDPIKYGGGQAVMWFFQWAFATAGATIVSGGVAERVRFPGYAIFSILMSAFIYPVVVCSTWGYGWLEVFVKDKDGNGIAGYIDFAGSGVVHLTGGVGAFVGAAILGRRTGRFDPSVDQSEFSPHSQPLIVLGTFILWFGWCGFNPGSTLGMSDNGTALKAAHVMMNTTLSAALGGLTVFILRYFQSGRKYDLSALCNGILAGLVSITAPCSNVESGSAFIIGIVGGFIYVGSSTLMQKIKIDDPVDAASVHGACGIWGCLAAALFDFGSGMDKHHGWSTWSAVTWEEDGETKHMTTMNALAANLAEIGFVIAWSGGMSAIAFGVLKAIGLLRLDEETEMMGTDTECASPRAYNLGPAPASSSNEAPKKGESE